MDLLRERKGAAFRLLAILLFLGLCAGCGKKYPALFEEAAFMQDLQHASSKGAGGIVVLAPGSGLPPDALQTVARYAEKSGVIFPLAAVQPGLVPYNANSDEARLAAFAGALDNPEAEVLWAMRGGYGSSRLLAGLSKLPLPEKQKVLVGYSDITFLHLYLHAHGWKSVHGSMFWEFHNPDKDAQNFRLLASLLSGRLSELHYTGLRPFNEAARTRTEPLRGVLDGGNLTCLAAAAGTPWFPDGAGKILFLEDVEEPGYKIDRMLVQLRDSGLLDGVQALLLGEFTQGDEHTEYALARFAAEFDKPVFRTELFGHGKKNYPLILNAPAQIERTAEPDGSFALRMAAEDLGR